MSTTPISSRTCEVQGRIAKTHLASNTAFRGFGGPQGMVVGEEILDRVARFLGLPVDQVRERNFYREGATPDRNTTHYGQPVVDNHLPELWAQLRASSAYRPAPRRNSTRSIASTRNASAASRSRR